MLRLSVIALAVTAFVTSPMVASAQTVFTNFNGSYVTSTGATAPTFNLLVSTDLSRVDIYTEDASASALFSSGTVKFSNSTLNVSYFVPVTRSLGPTQYNDQFTSWLSSLAPQTTLAAGQYTVTVDQNLQGQWAHNGESGNNGFLNVEGKPTPATTVPEPSSLALMGVGLFAAAVVRRKRA